MPTVGGGVVMQVHRSNLMRVFGLASLHGAVGVTSSLLLSGSGPMETLLPPEAMHPLLVHPPALAPQHTILHQPPPADVVGCDFIKPTPKLGLLDIENFDVMPLGTATLVHHLAGKSLRNPEHGSQGFSSPAAPFRAQKFTFVRSVSIAFSSTASAKNFLR